MRDELLLPSIPFMDIDAVDPGGPGIHILRRAATAIVVGLAVGSLTSLGQTHLNGPLEPLVNSASAWLVAPFFVGSSARNRLEGALLGFTACVLQLVAYTAVSELRGFPTGESIFLFWTICAVLGGPVFGAAGQIWRAGDGAIRGLGPAVLAAVFVAEGIWTYMHMLDSLAAGLLWVTIGVCLELVMTRGRPPLWRSWILLTVPVGLLGEMALASFLTSPL